MTERLQALKEERAELERQREAQSHYIRACRRAYGYEDCDQCEHCLPKHCGLRQDLRATDKQLAANTREINEV